MTPLNATNANFDDIVLAATEPVLVDFWAPWCGPCKAMAPALDDVAADFAGSATVVKVDIQADPDLASRFGIGTVPTLSLFKDGVEVTRVIGAQTRLRLSALIDGALV